MKKKIKVYKNNFNANIKAKIYNNKVPKTGVFKATFRGEFILENPKSNSKSVKRSTVKSRKS